jgi:hypothetical protein
VSWLRVSLARLQQLELVDDKLSAIPGARSLEKGTVASLLDQTFKSYCCFKFNLALNARSRCMRNGFRALFWICVRLRSGLGENPYRIYVVTGTKRDQNELGKQPRRKNAKASD